MISSALFYALKIAENLVTLQTKGMNDGKAHKA